MTVHNSPDQRLILDFASSGHHSKYLRQLVRYGLCAEPTGRTRLLISRDLLARTERELTAEERGKLRQRASTIEEHPAYIWLVKWIRARAIVEKLFLEYLIARNPAKCEIVLLYLDPFLFQLACLPLPRKGVSGLLFRTSFHYRHVGFPLKGFREKALFVAKYIMCYVCSRRPGILRILGLDPSAEQYAEKKWRTTKYITVPDPIGPEPGVPPSCSVPPRRSQGARRLFLICGELSCRKGVLVALRSLSSLEPDYLRRVSLQLVGQFYAPESDVLLRELNSLRERQPIEIGLDDRFVSDLELDEHICRADVVLALYERSYGSSGTVIRAAMFGRPVIASHQGLVGHLVRVHRLGAAVNAGDIGAVAKAIRSFISTGRIAGFDAESACAYAASCDPSAFAQRFLSLDNGDPGAPTRAPTSGGAVVAR